MRCEPAHHFTVAKSLGWRSAIDADPPYQRTSSVWTLDRQQLFIDSLLNGYDVPKIYLHDLRGRHPTKVYAVVDGKQRLTAIWSFLRDGFPLADTFRIEVGETPEAASEAAAPVGALRFSELDPHWRSVLLRTYLSVVLIRNATEEDIDELFSRLNNGVPLDASERRNAISGEMAALVRATATRPEFAERLGFPNDRLGHLDLAARLLALEHARLAGGVAEPDLSDAGLEAFVREGRQLPRATRAALTTAVDRRLAMTAVLFEPDDPLLDSPEAAFAWLSFASEAVGEDPAGSTVDRVRSFLATHRRQQRNQSGGGVRHAVEAPSEGDLRVAYGRYVDADPGQRDARRPA